MGTMFAMPKLDMSMQEGEVVKWLAKEGQPVNFGDEILEVETGKVAIAVDYTGECGKLIKIYASEGEVVEVGKPLCYVGKNDEWAPSVGNNEQGSPTFEINAPKHPGIAAMLFLECQASGGIPHLAAGTSAILEHIALSPQTIAFAQTIAKNKQGNLELKKLLSGLIKQDMLNSEEATKRAFSAASAYGTNQYQVLAGSASVAAVDRAKGAMSSFELLWILASGECADSLPPVTVIAQNVFSIQVACLASVAGAGTTLVFEKGKFEKLFGDARLCELAKASFGNYRVKLATEGSKTNDSMFVDDGQTWLSFGGKRIPFGSSGALGASAILRPGSANLGGQLVKCHLPEFAFIYSADQMPSNGSKYSSTSESGYASIQVDERWGEIISAMAFGQGACQAIEALYMAQQGELPADMAFKAMAPTCASPDVLSALAQACKH
ncbi:MAG: hypothetical protein FWG10_13785 [Eubacteriaceae bacterium]|nr:hypothetical protein [Eubacteriaceae bacterium]